MNLVPVTQKDAQRFVADHHRHLPNPPPGSVFVIGVEDEGELVGVLMAGRPVARQFDDGLPLEVNRTAVAGGCANANSMLYAAAWRAAKALGWRRLVTYTEASESGASLRAAGWQVIAERPARGDWAQSSVRRVRSGGRGGIQRTLWEAR